MNWSHLIEIGILAFSTLLAPVLPIVIKAFGNRSKRRSERGQRLGQHPDSHKEPGPSEETGRVHLPLVFLLLLLLLSLTLDIYVVVRQTGLPEISSRSVRLLNDVTVLVAALQTMVMALLASQPIIRRKYQELLTELTKTSDQLMTLQRRSDTREKTVVKALTRALDEQAAMQREFAGREKAQVEAFTKALEEQAATHERLLKEIEATHQPSRALSTRVQEALPGRKPAADLKRRRDAPHRVEEVLRASPERDRAVLIKK